MYAELMVTISFPVFDLEHGGKLLKVVDGVFSCRNMSVSAGNLHFHHCQDVDGGKDFLNQVVEAIQLPVAHKFRICDCNSTNPFSGTLHQDYWDFEIGANDVVKVKVETDDFYGSKLCERCWLVSKCKNSEIKE